MHQDFSTLCPNLLACSYNSVDWSSVPGCDVELEKAKKCRLSNGDIVIARTGGTVGKSYLVEALQEEDFAVFASYLIRVVPSQHMDSRYLKLVLESPIYWVQLSDSTTGTGQPNVNATSLKGFVLPLPPLAEQKRIVEKVDELMGLCDRLSSAKQTRDNLRQKLRESAIASLMDTKTDEDLDAAWALVRDNWHTLSKNPEDVNSLRQAVLQLATRGKIVDQNAIDKPAYQLLEAIRTERQILLKESKIQKPKKLPIIQSDELPFEIPKSWEWTRLGELCFQVSDGPHFSPNYVSKEEGIPFLSTRNIRTDGIQLDSAKYISKQDYEEFCKRVKPEVGDILYTKGGTTGIAIVNNLDIEFTVWVHVAVLKIAKSSIYPQYLAHVLNSPHCYGLSQKYTHGSSNKDLGLTRMILITIPLPPLAEQKRIVAKVDELMQLCDQLEASLRQSQQRAESLAASAISHLTI